MFGHDISKWQSNEMFENLMNDDKVEFIILKATEGKTYVDPKFHVRAEVMERSGHKLMGVYHFARPDNGNTPQEEAENFYNNIRSYHCRAFLDVEGNATLYPEWVMEFLDWFNTNHPEYNCGIYCNLWTAKNRLTEACNNYPFWIAHYSDTDAESRECVHWEGECMVQFTSKYMGQNLDADETTGLLEAYNWYGNFADDTLPETPEGITELAYLYALRESINQRIETLESMTK